MPLDESANREKAKAALSSVIWSLFLTGIKMLAGWQTNSLGILSEALHSLLDFFAATITFYAVRASALPPDREHPYGHEKVENLSALVETLLLLITCIWITWEAIQRIFFEEAEINLTWWAYAVVVISLVVDVNRASMLNRVAKKHKSHALEADALHFTTDIWSSAVVLAGLVCVGLASFAEQGGLVQKILHRADSVAALFVAGLILRVSWGLSKKSIHALMDGGSDEIYKTVQSIMEEKLPSNPVLGMRVREVGPKAFVEMTVGMFSDMHLDDAHAISERVQSAIAQALPGADITVVVKPLDYLENQQSDEMVNCLAIRHGFRAHGFSPAMTPNGKFLIIDVEVPGESTLEEMEPSISSFEDDVKSKLSLYKIITRIQPLRRVASTDRDNVAKKYTADDIHQKVRMVLEGEPDVNVLEKIDMEDMESTQSMVVYCKVKGDFSIAECYETASRAERRLLHALPGFVKIVVVLKPVDVIG